MKKTQPEDVKKAPISDFPPPAKNLDWESAYRDAQTVYGLSLRTKECDLAAFRLGHFIGDVRGLLDDHYALKSQIARLEEALHRIATVDISPEPRWVDEYLDQLEAIQKDALLLFDNPSAPESEQLVCYYCGVKAVDCACGGKEVEEEV